jgi:V8-like Glu-specific endopeptidase
MTVLPGSSGSGIFNEKGKLVSITTSVLNSKEVSNSLTVGVNGATIKAFMEGTSPNVNNPR